MKRLRILVTDAHARAALGAVRSLGRAGHTVIAAYPESSERPPAVSSRHCAGTLRYPRPDHDQAGFREWICDQANRRIVDAILPVTEPSIVGVAAARKELPGEVLALVPSDAALEYTLSKFNSARMALAIRIPTPATIFLSDGRSPVASSSPLLELGFPLVIKTDNAFTEDGGYVPGRTFVVADAEEAHRVLEDLEPLRAPVIAQQFIAGTGEGACLLRFRGQTYLRFAHRRLHEFPYTGGASSYRESLRDDELLRLGEQLLDAIEYDGVAMVEFRRGARDGRPYLLEINGRLWGSLALALHCGVDFPAALVRCHAREGGPADPQPPYRAGVRCRNVYPGEVLRLTSVVKSTRTPAIGPAPSRLGTAARFVTLFLDPRVHHDYFWWTDPAPGLRQAWRMVQWIAGAVWDECSDRLRKRRAERCLRERRKEHEARRQAPRYFAQPLRRLLFLCYGNICRSPFAASYWNARVNGAAPDASVATSAGLHPSTGRRSPGWLLDVAREYNVELAEHRSRAVTRHDVEEADAVFVMDCDNYERMLARFPWVKDKTYLLGLFGDDGRGEIADPYGKGKVNGRACCDQILGAVDGLRRQVVRS